jgi:hypothetical protein
MMKKLTGPGTDRDRYQIIRRNSKMFHGDNIETKSTDSSEWQTTRSRRTAVPRGTAVSAYKMSGSGYVPPSLRSAEAKKPASLCEADFPTFGATPKASMGAWGAKASFAQKINDLIAHEQRTEAEKEAEKEAAREAAAEMDGWESLSLCFDKERYLAYAKMFTAGARLERLVTDSAITGWFNNDNSTPMRYTTDYDNLNDDSDIDDDE